MARAGAGELPHASAEHAFELGDRGDDDVGLEAASWSLGVL